MYSCKRIPKEREKTQGRFRYLRWKLNPQSLNLDPQRKVTVECRESHFHITSALKLNLQSMFVGLLVGRSLLQIISALKLILLSMFVALPVRGFTFGDYFWEFALKSAGSSRRGKLNQQYIGIVAENCCILSFLGYPSPIFLQRLR